MPGPAILIVDDTPVNLKLTRILLEHDGYEVRTATSAEEALRTLESFRPRLVLADIQMPGMDGLEMTRRIKRDPRNRDILVVALTALAMQGDEEKAREAGCDGYITKPIDTRALAARVRGYLHEGEGSRPAASNPFDAAASNDLRERFLEEARREAPLWVAELHGHFDAARAQALAHQWVGSGGLLGFRRISEMARAVETILREKPLDTGELRESVAVLIEELKNPSVAASEPVSAPVAPVKSRPLVLIADDDPTMRALMRAFIQSQEMDCQAVSDGRAALTAIREAKPQAVVLDVNMPEMSGYTVLAALRAEGATVKVLLVTADEHPDTTGADDFLVKPVHPAELVLRLRKLLGE